MCLIIMILFLFYIITHATNSFLFKSKKAGLKPRSKTTAFNSYGLIHVFVAVPVYPASAPLDFAATVTKTPLVPGANV